MRIFSLQEKANKKATKPRQKPEKKAIAESKAKSEPSPTKRKSTGRPKNVAEVEEGEVEEKRSKVDTAKVIDYFIRLLYCSTCTCGGYHARMLYVTPTLVLHLGF